MYKVEVVKKANAIEKEMKRYIMMMTTMEVQVYEELDRRGYEMDLISGGNDRVIIVIYRK